MKNKIIPFKETPRRREIVQGLLSRMDADIVSPDGNLPDITVVKVERLMSGGKIYFSADKSSQCFLETDSDDVWYRPDGTMYYEPNITYIDRMVNPKKHAMKEKSYHFCINLAGQRSRSK